jgi:hypothetical protein
MMRSTTRLNTVLLAASVAIALSGCGLSADRGGVRSSQTNSLACTSRVTPDCSGYLYANPRPGTVVVTAPKSSAVNNREFFWSPSSPIGSDLTVCATFVNGQGFDQQGVVLRLHPLPSGRVSGVTVTRNVWMGAFNVFNYHVWNTEADPSSPFTQFGSTIVSPLPISPATYPLNLCARTVASSNRVQFVVWTQGQAMPAWGSALQGGEATIPASAPSAGRGGWFAGHLRPGTNMRYANLSINGVVQTDLP